MWTGTSALNNIDQTLQTIRNEVVRLDAQLSQLTQTMAENQRHRVKIINDIATVRLSEIESGDLLESLSAADQDAVELLAQREAALSTLNDEIDKLNLQLLESETEREALLAEVNNTSQAVVNLEADVQAQLKVDELYLAAFKYASESESIADESDRKVDRAQQDMAEKAKPYQADKLFMYLWKRKYGTTDYKGGLFARFMDGWVANVIDYEDGRVNYWNLTEIPKRLAQHADETTNVADEARMALQQLELDALETEGKPQLEQNLDSLRELLDHVDDQIENRENDLNTKLTDRARFIVGEDSYIQRCLERLTQVLQHNDLQAVHRYVRATTSPTDDHLVIELQGLDDRLDDVNGDLADVRRLHDSKISRLKELEQVRRNFKNSRFDDVRSGFGNETLLAGVLGQFLQGIGSGSDLWRVIQRNQRYRNVASLPDFGSGGLGRGRSGNGKNGNLGDLLGGGRVSRPSSPRRTRSRQSTWHWPTPRRGGGGFRAPRRSSGGGFRTGGGF